MKCLQFFILVTSLAKLNFISSEEEPCPLDTTKPTYTDLWGYEMDWYNLEDGWTEMRRKNMSKIEERLRYQMKRIPGFTKIGYKKMKMPKKLHQLILKARQTDNFTYPDCEADWAMFNCQRVTKDGKIEPTHNLLKMNLQSDKEIGVYLRNNIRMLLEDWCGEPLDKNMTMYGIRRYLRDSWMALHLDKLPTHIISAILQVLSLTKCQFAKVIQINQIGQS